MTPLQLLALSLAASVLTAGAGWMVARALESRVADAALREQVWAFAFYLPALPVLVIGLFLLLPAQEIRLVQVPVDVAPAPTTAPIPAATAVSFAEWLQAAALAVAVLAALLCFLRAAHTSMRLLRLHRLMRTTTPASRELQSQVERLARGLGVATPDLRVLPTGAETFLSGLRRPVLVLPDALAAAPDQPATAAVCAHELAHLRRGDHRTLWAEEFLLALLAINPLLGAVRRRRAAAREEACDALALAGGDARTRRAYARALLSALRGPVSQDDVPALTFTHSKRTFAMRRLQAILTPIPPAAPRLRRLSIGASAVIAAGVCTASVALASQREPTVEIVPALTAQASPESFRAPIVAPSARPTSIPEARKVMKIEPVAAPIVTSAPVVDQTDRSSLIRNPSWAQPPVPQFPAAAAANNVSQARVVLRCTARTDGRLSNCAVVDEDPVGNGFGAAAISAAQAARLSPRTVDTAPPDATVMFSVAFRAA